MSCRDVLSTVVGIIGFGLVWHYGGFSVAAGVFLAMWGNNLMLSERIER